MNEILTFAHHTLHESARLFAQMAPYLLLGFLANGLVALLIPERWINRHLGKPGFRGVLYATLLGIPLPLCSCSVLPMAMGLRARGASIGATIAFLIATPQTGVDSVLVTGQIIGWPFAFFKVGAALVTGLAAGILAEKLLPSANSAGTDPAPNDTPAAMPTWNERFRTASHLGFYDFPASLGGVLLFGIFIGGLLSVAIPPDLLTSADPGNRLLSMVAILLLAVPMYVCSTGSVPIAAGFHHAGVSQGALLIFLMAGPATNIAEISVIRKRLGWRALAIFLGVIVVGSFGLGYGFENVRGLLDFNQPGSAAAADAHAHHAPANTATDAAGAQPLRPIELTVFEWLSVVALAALLSYPPLKKMRPSGAVPQEDATMAAAEPNPDLKTYEFDLQGLNCEHCIRSAKNSLEGLPGLESLTLNLHKAVLKGKNIDAAEVIQRIKKQGFEAQAAIPA